MVITLIVETQWNFGLKLSYYNGGGGGGLQILTLGIY